LKTKAAAFTNTKCKIMMLLGIILLILVAAYCDYLKDFRK